MTTRQMRTIKPTKNFDGQFPYTETVDSFVKRGGAVIVCPPREAGMSVAGSVSIDGEICITAANSPEYIPNYVVSEQTYNASQHDIPDVALSHACREAELQNMPRDLRVAAETRWPDSDESADNPYENYYDELESDLADDDDDDAEMAQ